jgi:hypothetical protein
MCLTFFDRHMPTCEQVFAPNRELHNPGLKGTRYHGEAFHAPLTRISFCESPATRFPRSEGSPIIIHDDENASTGQCPVRHRIRARLHVEAGKVNVGVGILSSIHASNRECEQPWAAFGPLTMATGAGDEKFHALSPMGRRVCVGRRRRKPKCDRSRSVCIDDESQPASQPAAVYCFSVLLL